VSKASAPSDRSRPTKCVESPLKYNAIESPFANSLVGFEFVNVILADVVVKPAESYAGKLSPETALPLESKIVQVILPVRAELVYFNANVTLDTV